MTEQTQRDNLSKNDTVEVKWFSQECEKCGTPTDTVVDVLDRTAAWCGC